MSPATFGLFGDALTFFGGGLLALDAIWKGKEFRKIKNMEEMLRNPLLAKVKLKQGGITLNDENGAELLYINRSVRRAIWGSVVMTIGFVFLGFSRVLEILHPP